MKVILLKDTKEGKEGEIVEVSDGYGTNYLIRNKLAISLNKTTQRNLDIKKANNKAILDKEIANANRIKAIVESTILTFQLKEKNNVVIGSITKKQINQALREKNIHLGKHAVENVHIQSIGLSKIEVNLDHKIKAMLKVEVKNGK